MNKLVQLLLAGAVGISSPGAAPATAGRADDILLNEIGEGATLERYIMSVLQPIRRFDADGDGLDRGDLSLDLQIRTAQARASAVSQVLMSDLDGDQKVTRAEAERTAFQAGREAKGQADAMLKRFDADGDGVVTLAEAERRASVPELDQRLEPLLALDPNGDGRLTAAELERLARTEFARIDADGDTVISRAEYEVIAARQREASQRLREARQEAERIRRMKADLDRCAVPPPPAAAEVVLASFSESETLSSAAVGDQEQETHLMRVRIEPGQRPLYLALTSHASMVWRLEGDVRRVARAVVSTSRSEQIEGRDVRISASGVAGLPSDRVTMLESDCLPYFSRLDEGGPTRERLSMMIGRAPDRLAADDAATAVSLPSGALQFTPRYGPDAHPPPPPPGQDGPTWQGVLYFWPGGVAAVDPRTVTARVKVEPYQVLPAQAGLAQLTATGALVRISENGVVGSYRIVKPIPRFPPGLYGAHSASFTLAAGVPLPAGSPGHSNVKREGMVEAPRN